MELELLVQWTIGADGEREVLDPNVLALLRGVQRGGHLNFAAKATGVSYRHAWGLLRQWEKRLGQPLLSARQGRGAHVTAFGEALLDIATTTEARLRPTLEQTALDVAAQLSEAAAARHQAINIVSSHNERVRALQTQLATQHRVSLDVAGSEHALNRYRRGDADIAGFHLPLGELGRTVGAHLIGLLDNARDRVFLLEQRGLGLVSRADCPVASLAALAGSRHQFVNRQSGSGTRLVIDALLDAAGLAPASINGYDNEEHTHTAVAAIVASGSADAGVASADAAARMQLLFEPLVDERFYLVMPRTADSPLRRAVQTFCTEQDFPDRTGMKADELTPSIAVLKRIHRAGFWKAQSD